MNIKREVMKRPNFTEESKQQLQTLKRKTLKPKVSQRRRSDAGEANSEGLGENS